MDEPDDSRVIDDVVAALRIALSGGRALGTAGADAAAAAVDEAVRRLVDRRATLALRRAPEVPDVTALAGALEPGGAAASLAGRVGSASRRLQGRSRIARSVARRSPTGLALRWGPLAVDVVRDQVRAIDAVAAHLVARARRAGLEPDPERLRVAVVQALTGQQLDPDRGVDHTRLARDWIRQAGGRMVPFGPVRRLGGTRRTEVLDVLSRFDVGRLLPR